MELDLEAIKERAEKATPGPWEALHYADDHTGETRYLVQYPDGEDVSWLEEPDAAFIAAARSDVPRLVQEVERLREALESADARFEEIIYAKGTLKRKVESMAQEAYFGQKEVVRALSPQPEGAQRRGFQPLADALANLYATPPDTGEDG